MQFKIIVGACAVLIVVFVFASVILREPDRMVGQTAAFEARQIEAGAELYQTHCANCHGENGRAQVCYNAQNDKIPCAGIPLSNIKFVCTEASGQTEVSFSEIKRYLQTAITDGNSKHDLSVIGQVKGGALSASEIENLTAFIANWVQGEHISHLCYFTPTPYPYPRSVAELPQGDSKTGETLYEITYGCAACHGSKDVVDSNLVGPWGGAWIDTAASRKSGYTAADYLYESILLPSAFIAPECPTGPCVGPPSMMPANFGQRISPQDMADLLAYLLGTADFESRTLIEFP